MNTGFLGPAVATVLTVYGIETPIYLVLLVLKYNLVATVLTVYGIETFRSLTLMLSNSCNSTYRLRY